MKRSWVAVLLIVLCACASVAIAGRLQDQLKAVISGPVGGEGVVYIINEPVSSGSTPAGWTNYANPPNWNDSGRLLFVRDVNRYSTYAIGSDKTEVWGYINFEYDTIDATNIVLGLNNTTNQFVVEIRATGTLRINHGTSTATTVGTVAPSTPTHIWYYYEAGTGTDGAAWVAMSTDGTLPTSGDNYASTSVGTATSAINNLRLYADGTTGYSIWMDNIQLAEFAIGAK